MKKRSTSLISVLLTVFLVFSMLFMTFAQQNPKYEDERAAAKADAERDADNDVNKFTWFYFSSLAGIGAVLPGGCSLGLAELGSDSLSAEDKLIGSLCMCGGSIVAFLPAVLAISIKPTPPSERLLGKSPEYIDAYVDIYVRKVRRRRGRVSAIGSAVGVGLTWLAFGEILFR